MYFSLFSKSSVNSSLRLIAVSRWAMRIVWFAYAVFLFVMTHITIPKPVAHVTSGWDKPLHLGAYFVLAVLTAMVCVKAKPLRISHGLLLPLLMIFAAFDEILQGPFGRYPDVRDWVSDCVGIVLGLAFAQIAIWIIKHPAIPFQLVLENPGLESRSSGNTSGFAQ